MNVRPHKVFQAARWLSLNSSLYKEEDITFNEEWKLNDSTEDFQECSGKNNIFGNSQSINAEKQKCSSDGEWSEDEAEIVAGVTDTMLTATNFVDDSEHENILNIAPGKGSRPKSIFKDKFCEELAYLGIFFSEPRPGNEKRLVKSNYCDICKSELRCSDRRCTACVENIFFKTKKLQMKTLLGMSQIALRKTKGNKRPLTAGYLKQPGNLE